MAITIYPSQFNMREDGSYEQLPAIKGETGEQGVPGVGALPGGTAGQVPVKQSADDYDVAWEDICWKLVWENASPHSAFGAQTVSINLSGYSWVMVRFTRNAADVTNNVDLNFFAKVGEENLIPNATGYSATAHQSVRRIIESIATSGITFQTGTRYTSYGTNGTNDANALIPYQIYAR